jgi:hypothetical protein
VLRHQVQPYPRDSAFVVGLIAWSIITPVGLFLNVSVLRNVFTIATVPRGLHSEMNRSRAWVRAHWVRTKRSP